MGFDGRFEIWLRTAGVQPSVPLLRQGGAIILVFGTIPPSTGTSGYGFGAAFYRTNPVRGELVEEILVNTGNSAACSFEPVSG